MAALSRKHAHFKSWAEEQGVKISGLSVASLPGKGIGVVANRKLKKDEVLISVPAAALVTLDTKFVQEQKIRDCSVHGTVAAALTLNHENSDLPYKKWELVWPTMDDLQSMPFTWPQKTQDLLPLAVKALLKYQQTKFDRDCIALDGKVPDSSKALYTYYWLIVNTRCFYWTHFKRAREAARKGKTLARDDCMALCPFADYLNHADDGCTFFYDTKGVAVVCNREYDIGEEVVVSYGSHSNDYLLVEYGFILPENKYDNTKLDHLILPMLTNAQANLLEEHRYLGDYTLDSTGVCYRTQVAIRSTFTTSKRMQEFLLGTWEGEKDSARVDYKCMTMLQQFKHEIEDKLAEVENLETSTLGVSTLTMRWIQILQMVDNILS